MTGIRYNTESVWHDKTFPFSQAVVEPDGRRVHLTGQVAWTPGFEVVGRDDPAAQTDYAIDNIERVLFGLGGRIEDAVSVTMYYVRDEDLEAIQEVRRARFSLQAGPAATGVKVAALVDPALLVELTVVAVIPDDRFVAPKS
ncbi:MAG: RidA family protein [Kiloniellales bacterium]|nr:RidA family protein [Kiloniellales bacterium]